MMRTILLVEDDDTVAGIIEIALQSLDGIEIVVLFNGREAFNFLLQHRNQVAVLITDLIMPVMNGFELIERIRANETYASVPIVVVSGDTNEETPARLKQLGINAYFNKPFSPSQIRRTVELLLHNSYS